MPAAARELAQHLLHLPRGDGIETVERLIEDKQRRGADEGRDDREFCAGAERIVGDRLDQPRLEAEPPHAFGYRGIVERAVAERGDELEILAAGQRLRQKLAAGAPGKRFCLPNANIMMHQPLGGFRGPAADIEIQATEILKWRDRLDKIYAKHTGQDLAIIVANRDRDKFFDATEAKEFGLVDDVVVQRTTHTT